ncbi:hypothetical protein GCM10009007_13740 [Formosimonas limnophila]|uniref:Uncharacterized protein n=1 Tax=Formosimonas limnophila TaxID=1384487 RepID=A0A8J3CHG1_9BURK|nr:hypothetical protein [Formosimonas limnophila]GHA73845.1 hypothetical protein GCM10009007_13740 [Formosimonas limnophila]
MLKKITRVANLAFFEFFGQENCRNALSAYRESRGFSSLNGKKQKLVYSLLKAGNVFGVTDRVLNLRHKELSNIQGLQVYDKHVLNLMTNRILDMPEVVVDVNAPIRVNVLVPGFAIESISAGFFGVFNVAKFAAKCGFKVRLVLFDNFYYDEQVFKKSLNNFPSFSTLFEEVEVEYIGARNEPLVVSPFDGVIATVWYSAYFAEKIQKLVNPKPFLYLIQDYETAFYPFSSLNAFSDQTYKMNFNALVSTEPLLHYMLQFKGFSEGRKFVSFNNACSSILPDWESFKKAKETNKKRFVFYSRPAVNRNMFELAALSIIHAFEEGVFGDGSEWEFFGMGLGDVEIKLNSNISITQLPRMSLKEYEENMYTFDLCLSLMASPHPSIVPFDLSSAGALVVTNAFETKNSGYFKEISDNIYVAQPTVNDIVNSLRVAAENVDKIEERYERAQKVKYPNNWGDVWKPEHEQLLYETFRG